MTGFTLRTALPGDLADVTRLLEISYRQLMPSAYGQAATEALLPIIGRAKPELLASGSYYLAVTDEGAVIGAGGWTTGRPGTGEIEAATGHIRHVATDPSWTGKGVGRALMQRSFERARAAGIRRLECYSSLNAVDFYRRVGFKEVRRIDVPVGEDLIMPSLLMERAL